MIIQVDQEGRHAIQQLCDIALKSAGMQNLNPVNKILRSVEMLPVPAISVIEEEPQPKSPEKEDEEASQAETKKSEKELEEKPKEEPKEEVIEEKPKEEVPEVHPVEGLE